MNQDIIEELKENGMTRERAKELLPIIQAFADGKTIQVKGLNSDWETVSNPKFLNESDQYRIKPEPRDFWITNGTVFVLRLHAYSQRIKDGEVIHVREVI